MLNLLFPLKFLPFFWFSTFNIFSVCFMNNIYILTDGFLRDNKRWLFIFLIFVFLQRVTCNCVWTKMLLVSTRERKEGPEGCVTIKTRESPIRFISTSCAQPVLIFFHVYISPLQTDKVWRQLKLLWCTFSYVAHHLALVTCNDKCIRNVVTGKEDYSDQ